MEDKDGLVRMGVDHKDPFLALLILKMLPFIENTLDHQLPRSAGTPLSVNSQQQQTEAEHPEYKRLLSELCKHKKDVKRLLERLNIDKPGEMKQKSSLTNVIQVMEGTRKGG